MSPISISASADFFQSLKFIACFLAAFCAASLSACGVSTPGGYVMGTTSYLEEFNRGRGGIEVTASERRQLDKLVEEVR